MSSSNCYFLNWIQISQEAGKVVWYSHLLKNFPQLVMIHTVKDFGIVNEAEVDIFLEFSCFFCDPWMLVIWSLVPLPFLKPAWISGRSRFRYCWSLAWRILSISVLACEMSAILRYGERSLALLFFGIGMKTDLFQSCGHCWVFQICRHMEYSTLTVSSFRILCMYVVGKFSLTSRMRNMWSFISYLSRVQLLFLLLIWDIHPQGQILAA